MTDTLGTRLPCCAAVLIVFSCATTPSTPGMSEAARAHLVAALDTMETHVIAGDTVDWERFRTEVTEDAGDAQIPVDTYAAIRAALGRLNPHSFLQISDSMVALERERHPDRFTSEDESQDEVTSPFSRRRQEREIHRHQGRTIGRIAVPSFGGRHTTAFADTLQSFVRELAEAGACGWIVDLRGNGGGNMWPMLAGIGALLQDGNLGAFQQRGESSGTWYVRDGASGIRWADGREEEAARVGGEPFRLERTPPVSVLIDGGTASSGEAVAIAFIGRPNTRSFGVRSFGFTTVNDGFRMPDGSNMVLTVGVNADRNGRAYPDPLVPDQEVHLMTAGTVPTTPPAPDPQIQAALEWVVGQPGCRG